MAVAEITVIPLVEGSIRPYIDRAIEEIKKCGLKYEVDALGTTVEGNLDQLLDCIKRCHQAVLEASANRVITEVRIDEKKSGLTLEEELAGYR